MTAFQSYLIRKFGEVAEAERYSDPSGMRNHRTLLRAGEVYDYAELSDSALEAVLALGHVASAEPDDTARIPQEVEPDQVVTSLSKITGPDANSYLNVPELHKIGIKGKGAKVAVLDTGLDAKWAARLKNLGLLAGAKSFVGEDPLAAKNFHGSHVAGIVHRVAPEAEILVVQVLGPNGSGTYSQIMEGIAWAISQGATILNLSLGGPKNATLNKVVDNAVRDKRVTIVAAAGNDGQNGNPADRSSPASAEEPLTTANTDYRTGGIASSSSAGECVDVAAPGYQINSWHLDGKWGIATGTSMAAPFIAGIAALLAAEGYKARKPRQSILKTARNTNLAPRSEGRGVADAAGSVAYARKSWPKAPPKEPEPEPEEPAPPAPHPTPPTLPAWVTELLRKLFG